ncbi:MAG: hypothetical protein ABSE87_14160 [Terracidiphilus sp.]
MQRSPKTASRPFVAPATGSASSRSMEDRVYQAVTVASILMVLGSLWLF